MKAIMIIISASYYGPKLSQPTCSKTMLQENPIHCVGFINASSFWNVWLAVYPHLIAPKSAFIAWIISFLRQKKHTVKPTPHGVIQENIPMFGLLLYPRKFPGYPTGNPWDP